MGAEVDVWTEIANLWRGVAHNGRQHQIEVLKHRVWVSRGFAQTPDGERHTFGLGGEHASETFGDGLGLGAVESLPKDSRPSVAQRKREHRPVAQKVIAELIGERHNGFVHVMTHAPE